MSLLSVTSKTDRWTTSSFFDWLAEDAWAAAFAVVESVGAAVV
jgi:hypothetical protein